MRATRAGRMPALLNTGMTIDRPSSKGSMESFTPIGVVFIEKPFSEPRRECENLSVAFEQA